MKKGVRMIRFISRAAVHLAFLITLLAVTAISASAQQLATLRVTVTDQSGGVIPQARVTLRNLETDSKRTEVSADTGVAVITAVPAGNYELTVESGQFNPYKSPVTLTVGQIAAITVTMRLSAAQQSVEVTGTTQAIDTEVAQVSQVIQKQDILDLPISGRDFIDFVLLTPTANVGRSTAVGAQSPFHRNRSAAQLRRPSRNPQHFLRPRRH